MRMLSQLLLLICFALMAQIAVAHTPHDDIFDVQVSPRYSEDNRLYVIVRNILKVSEDRGETWERRANGLTHWSMLYKLAVSGDGKTLYVTSLGDGIFVSTDGGLNWTQINKGLNSLVIDQVAASPSVGHVALASDTDGRLYRTTNGEQWEQLGWEFGAPTAIEFVSEHQVLVGNDEGAVFASYDLGRSWERTIKITEPPVSISSLGITGSGETMRIHVGTLDGRIATIDSKGIKASMAQVTAAPQAILSLTTATVGTHDERERLFAAAWDEGVYFSSDQGLTWQASNNGLTRDRQAPQLGRPSFSRLVPSPEFKTDQTLFLAGFDGVFRSEDGGNSWTHLTTLSMENIISLTFSPDFAKDGTMIVSTWVWGPYISRNGGDSWRPIVRGLRERFPRHHGLVRPFIVVFSPDFGDDGILFTSTWYEMFRSRNSGRRWHALPPFRSSSDGGIYHDGGYIAVSPSFVQDGTVFRTTRSGHVLRSTDGGDSFSKMHKTDSMIGSVVISPDFRADNTVLIGDKSGVHFSHDGGNSWSYRRLINDNFLMELPVSPGYPVEWKEAWHRSILDQREKEFAAKLAISPDFALDDTVYAALPNGLARSVDGGQTWTMIKSEPLHQGVYVETVALSPEYHKDSTLVISVRGLGTYMSNDKGESFFEIGEDLREKNVLLGHYFGMTPKFPAIVFSPTYSDDHTLYGFSGKTLYRSQDRGQSWGDMESPHVTLLTRARARGIYYARRTISRARWTVHRIVNWLRESISQVWDTTEARNLAGSPGRIALD